MKTIYHKLTILKKVLQPVLLITLALVYLLLQMQPVYGQGLSDEQLRLFNLGIDYYDIDQCKAVASGSSSTPSTPGSVFVIGDSLGNGLTNYQKDPKPLTTALGDGWSVSGDTVDGRTLSSGIDVAKAAPQGLKDANYVLVVLGSNRDNAKGNAAGIQEMVTSIKSASSSAKIFWLTTNLVETGGNLIDQGEVDAGNAFNTALSSAEGITTISNTVAPDSQGVHYSNYAPLAEVVAAGMKSSGATGSTPSSLREKLAMLIFARANTASEINDATSLQVGGVFVRPSDKNDASTYEAIKNNLNNTSPLIAVDMEGGRVQAPGDAIVGAIPSAQEMGSKTEDEIKKIAKDAGAKLAALGVNMDFAPVADIGGTNTAVIGDRAFANDADNVTKKAGAFAAGLSESGIISTLKHFPGHGSRDGDSHSSPVPTGPLAELEARDIIPFKTLSANAKTAIMMGHLQVPEWGAKATSINPAAYQYLRTGVGFNGVIVTDALNMEGIGAPTDEPSRAVAAITAGADMALVNSVSQVAPALDKLEAAGLSEERIDESVARISALRSQASAQDQNTAAGCQCSATGTVPIDGENPKRAYQYFISVGYSPEQAAGVIGNMLHESGVEPQRLQYTLPGTITPASEAVNSRDGWGIVQWTPGSKMINDVGVDKADDFAVQLDYLKRQLDGETLNPEKGPGDALKAATTIEEATLAFISFERFEDWNNSAGEAERQERIVSAKGVFDQYSSLGGAIVSSSSGSGCGGSSGVAGVNCPSTMEAHPTRTGYFKMPQAPNGEYTIYTSDSRLFGSKNLVCVLYTVGLAYDSAMGGKSKLSIGDLNASGHASHDQGIDVDLDGQGEVVAADHVNSPDKYSPEATITLGKMFVDTGLMNVIYWCEPGSTPKASGVPVEPKNYTGTDGSTAAIRDYAKQKKPASEVYCWEGHENHFHLNIDPANALEVWTPS